MKKIYLYHLNGNVDYFSTAKKLHTFLINRKISVHKHFSVFSRWLTSDLYYEININDESQEYCGVVKVN